VWALRELQLRHLGKLVIVERDFKVLVNKHLNIYALFKSNSTRIQELTNSSQT